MFRKSKLLFIAIIASLSVSLLVNAGTLRVNLKVSDLSLKYGTTSFGVTVCSDKAVTNVNVSITTNGKSETLIVSSVAANACTTIYSTKDASYYGLKAYTNYTVTANVDPANLINESNETDNTYSETMQVYAQDLTINKLGLNSDGKTFYVEACAGDINAANVKVNLTINNITESLNASSIYARDCAMLSTVNDFTYFKLSKGVEYTMTAVADPDKTIAETDENNNTKTAKVTMLPDLYVSEGDLYGSRFYAKVCSSNFAVTNVKVKFTINSISEIVNASSVQNTCTNVYSSKDYTYFNMTPNKAYTMNVLVDSDSVVPELNENNNSKDLSVILVPDLYTAISGLSSDGIKFYTQVCTEYVPVNGLITYITINGITESIINNITKTGCTTLYSTYDYTYFKMDGNKSYTMTTTIDPNNLVTETSETNNTRNTTVYITKPDLYVSSSATYAGGTKFDSKICSKNFSSNLTNVKVNITINGKTETIIANINANDCTDFKTINDYTYFGLVQGNSYTMTTTIDPDKTIAGEETSNNVQISTVIIAPDLYLGISSVDSSGKKFYTDVCTNSLTNLSNVIVNMTINGQTESITGTANANSCTKFTTVNDYTYFGMQTDVSYPLTAQVDPSNKIVESNETNNTSTWSVKILSSIDLKIYDLEYVKPDNNTFSFTVYANYAYETVKGVEVSITINNITQTFVTDIAVNQYPTLTTNDYTYFKLTKDTPYAVTAVIDPNNKISEYSETNNTLTGTVAISSKPLDFTLDSSLYDDTGTEEYVLADSDDQISLNLKIASSTSIKVSKFSLFMDTKLKTLSDGTTVFTSTNCNSTNALAAATAKFKGVELYNADGSRVGYGVSPTLNSANVSFANGYCNATDITYTYTASQFSINNGQSLYGVFDVYYKTNDSEAARFSVKNLTDPAYYTFASESSTYVLSQSDVTGQNLVSEYFVVTSATLTATNQTDTTYPTVYEGTQDKDFLKFKLESNQMSDISLGYLTISLTGNSLAKAKDIVDLTLYDVSTGLSVSNTLSFTSSSTSSTITFSGLNITIPKNQSVTLVLRGDVSGTAAIGATYQFSIKSTNDISAVDSNANDASITFNGEIKSPTYEVQYVY